MTIVGKHIIAELYGVEKELILLEEKVKSIVDYVVEKAELNEIGKICKQFYKKDYSGSPHGVTYIVLISESHIALHTWPEYELINLDIFTCGDLKKADIAYKLFLKKFKPKSYREFILDRG